VSSAIVQTVFLIGATGHIGNVLIDELAPDHEAGRLRVKVGVRSDAARALVEGKGVEAESFDLNRHEAFDAALAGADTVFLLRPYTLRQMMYGKLVTDAASRVGVQSMVTIGAYGRPETPWPVIAWNFLVEAYVERAKLGFTHLQPNYFMDNTLAQRDPASHTLFNRIKIPVSWIAAEDIAAVAAAVLRDPAAHAGKTYPLASEVADVQQIAGYMSEITGIQHTVGATPPEKMMERLLAQGREHEYALALVEYVDAVSRGEVPEIADTFDTVERVTGRKAVMFKEFLAKNLR
jgi:NAD(P)H dehydrogenase (quinone)